MTYDEAIDNAYRLLCQARRDRQSAEKYGPDTTAGDSGVLCLTLAAQYTAEAQAWATLAHAFTTRNLEMMGAGL